MTIANALETSMPALSAAVWEIADLTTSPEQQNPVPALQAWLREQPWPIARMILHCQDVNWTHSEMRQLERALLDSFSPKPRAAEMLNLLGRVVHRLNRLSSRSLPIPGTLCSFPGRRTPYYSQPRQPANISQDWRRVRRWQQVKGDWLKSLAQPNDSTSPVPLELVLLSAVLDGGLLHRDCLVAFVRALATPESSFEWLQDRLSILLSLSLHGQPQGELRRWYPDPLTAVLLLRVPNSELQELWEGHSSPSPLSDPVLARRLWQRLSGALRKHLTFDNQPRDWEHLFRTVAATLCTKIPPMLVAYARRAFVSPSMKPAAYRRFCGPESPTLLSTAASGTECDEKVEERRRRWSLPRVAAFRPPWLRLYSRALSTGSRTAILQSFQIVLTDSSAGAMARCVAEFAVHLVKHGSTERKKLHRSTVKKYVLAVARYLGSLLGEEDPTCLSGKALEGVYREVIETLVEEEASPGLCKQAAWELYQFHAFLQRRYQIEPMQETLLWRTRRGSMPVDAVILSLEEFERALACLDRVSPVRYPARVRCVAKLLLILGFKAGLRRSEARCLQLSDFDEEGGELLIRRSENQDVKTQNAIRHLRLTALLSAEELIILRNWKRQRLLEWRPGESDYLFAIPESGREVVPEEIFDLVLEAVHQVTKDPSIRYHHLRHSFGTWFLTRLLLADSRSTSDLFPDLPRTTAWLRDAATLREQLYGGTAITRKHGYLSAQYIGHSGPRMSCGHYIHLCDLLLHTALARREHLQSVTPSLVLASGYPQQTVYRWLQDGGPARLLERLYRDQFPKLSPRRQISDNAVGKAGKESHSVFSAGSCIDTIWTVLYRTQTEGISLQHLAEAYHLDCESLEKMLARARVIQGLRAKRGPQNPRHRMEHWTRDHRQPKQQEQLACPRRPTQRQRADQEAVHWLAPRLQVLARREPARVQAVLDHYIKCIWKTSNPLIFKDARRPERAREYLWFLRQLGFRREQIRFYFYSAVPGSPAEDKWRKVLRLTKRDPQSRRQSPNPKNRGAACWIGIEPVVWPEAKRNNTASAFGFRYTMLMASILLAGDGFSGSSECDQNKVSLQERRLSQAGQLS